MNVKEIVKQMTKRRNVLGWSQYRLAKESGLSREAIAKFELGKHMPKLDTLIRLCDALGIEVRLTERE